MKSEKFVYPTIIPAGKKIEGTWGDIFTSYFHFNRLKSLYRKGWLEHDISSYYCESVADHTSGMAFLSMMITSQFDLDLDTEKLLKMALLHDLAESKLGDITPRDKERYEQKSDQEIQIISEWFSQIPGGDQFVSLFHEFEAQESQEARFLKKIDKIEMILQASMYEKLEVGSNFETFFDISPLHADSEFKGIIQEFISALESLRRKKKKK